MFDMKNACPLGAAVAPAAAVKITEKLIIISPRNTFAPVPKDPGDMQSRATITQGALVQRLTTAMLRLHLSVHGHIGRHQQVTRGRMLPDIPPKTTRPVGT